MARRRMSLVAKRCIARESRKHYKKNKAPGQAVAIAFNVCRAKGYRSIPRKIPRYRSRRKKYRSRRKK